MRTIGIVRNVDHLGRFVIPIEWRRTLGITPGSPVEIVGTDEGILLRPVRLDAPKTS